ncbi:DUF2068 domain-containing protein [Cupriavidus sp. H19C3]
MSTLFDFVSLATMAHGSSQLGLKSIALFEAAKGALVILAGIGLVALLHRDAQALAEAIVSRFHINPASHYPTIFLSLLAHPTDGRLWAIGGSAAVYALMRFAEAYGLWRGLAWGNWIGVWSGGIYIPVEIYEAVRHPTWLHVSLAIANALVVIYLVAGLARHKSR